MRPLEHILLLRGDIDMPFASDESFAEHLDDFAHNHHIDMAQWFELEWNMLIQAETSEEKTLALDNLKEQYERIGNLKNKGEAQ